MVRVHVICEGPTEEMFIKELLSPALTSHDIHLSPVLIGRKGGNFRFERFFKDVQRLLLSDTTAYCTSFFDFYGLPDDFPGKCDAEKQSGLQHKSAIFIQEFRKALAEKIEETPLRRFIPYVQMYEFEALLFSSPEKLAASMYKPELADKFQKIRDDFASPEEINNSRETAPSKRILQLYPGYQKPLYGSLAAIEIGLTTIRQECRLFDGWVALLEALR